MNHARIQVREGGPRGMTVSVELPPAQQTAVSQVQQALFLLEIEVLAR